MAGDVVAQIFAHETHEVVARVAHMVLGLVLVPLHAHVAVDRVQALSHRAAALDVRLLDDDNLRSRPQYLDSYAAPHPPNPPPMTRTSASTNTVFLELNRPITQSFLILLRRQRRQRFDVECLGFVREFLAL